MKSKILYIDMDNVLVDFPTGVARLPQEIVRGYQKKLDEVPGIFPIMDPVPGAVESFERLTSIYDAYILSTFSWENPSAWSDKLLRVKKYLEAPAYKRLILTQHKNLSVGDYLIDDRTKNGVDRFMGKHIHFGSDEFPNWEAVVAFFTNGAT